MVNAFDGFDRMLRLVRIEERAWGHYWSALRHSARPDVVRARMDRWMRLAAQREETVSRYRRDALGLALRLSA